jgi:CRISPR-associated protein Cas5d
MEYFNKEFCLEVWGDYACFTRPEMKVERVSYDIITPSAARGIFEAIFWKPAIKWRITKIEVMNPIKWISVRRNEIGTTMSPKSKHIFIEEKRQQKAGLFLRDVKYRISAELIFSKSAEEKETRKDENPGKYNAMFERRASKGQCFNQPYLGCREFSANFRLIDTQKERLNPPTDLTKDMGFMLYDLDFTDETNPQPMFFRAQVIKGIITPPPIESEEVLK